MKWLLMLLAAGVLGLGISIHVDPPQPAVSPRMDPWMARLDGDGDMRISRSEYVQISDTLIAFDQVDLNKSGAIDTRELEVFLRTVDPMWTFAEPD